MAQIASTEFGGLAASDQNFGTLVGLKHGLLLESDHERKVLLPHAAVHRQHSGNHCEVRLDLSALREPSLFTYTLRDDLWELRGQKDRVAMLYLAHLHALTSHVLRDPFTLQTGTESALRLLRSARCRGNLCTGPDNAEQSEEQRVLLEIAKLSPTRRQTQQNGPEVVSCPLPGLCAHEGLAFLARDAMADIVEIKQLMGVDCSRVPIKECNELCGALHQRAYVRNREIYGLPARLVPEEENAINTSGLFAWAEDPADNTAVRSVASAVFLHLQAPLPPMKPSLKDMMLTNQPLKGILEAHLENASVGEWDNLSQMGLRDLWIPLYQAAIRGKEDRLGLLLAYLVFKLPKFAAHFQMLGAICARREMFAHLLLPQYRCYQKPDERRPNCERIRATVQSHLKAFAGIRLRMPTRREQEQADAEFEGRRDRHEQSCAEVCRRIESEVCQAWRQYLRQLPHDCQDVMVTEHLGLKDKLNSMIEQWWRAHELHNFLEGVMEKFATIQKPTNTSFDFNLPLVQAPPAWRCSFSLSEPPPSELEPSGLDKQWESGQSHSAMCLEPPFSPPPRRCPELTLWQDEEHSDINKALQEPLQRSWQLAHTENRNQTSHDYFPPDLEEQLKDSLEDVCDERELTWGRVVEAVEGRGRLDDLMRLGS